MMDVMDNELILFDRLNVIKDTIGKYGEDNFYISFSGGKDSTVLHHLVDMALPNNRIPRVYANTGIEYNDIVLFVKKLAESDDRFQIIKPSKNIKAMLEDVGYPFKSKEHSCKYGGWQRGSRAKSVMEYKDGDASVSKFACPSILKYQYEEGLPFQVSEYCCRELKKTPFKKWMKENNRKITMTGMQKTEGGKGII